MTRRTPAFCEAIAARVQLRVRYGGKERVIEPYCHGTDKKGNDVLRAFQVSSSDREVGWRLFHTAKMEHVEPTDGSFAGDRADYNPDDSQMRVHCCI